jgi:hypothetical protein
MIKYVCALCVLCVGTLSSCAPSVSSPAAPPFVLVTLDPNSTATATPFQPATAEASASSFPTATSSSTAAGSRVPTEGATSQLLAPAHSPTLPPLTPNPTNTRTQYALHVSLDYAGRKVAVNETIRYFNETGQSLSNIVLAVEPNLWKDCFSLSALNQDGAAITHYTLSGQRLTVSPARSLQPGAATTFFLGYSLALPAKSYSGTFGYLSYQINLTDWYPFIVPYSGGWVLHDPWSFGEHLVYDAADYDVTVQVNDPDVILAAGAPAEQKGSSTYYHLGSARTFVLSASDQFMMASSAVGSTKILSYYFSGDEGAGNALVWMATQSLGVYQAKFGPDPYPSLSVVETDVADGQEFDGLVFLGSHFYSEYNGTAKSNLVTIGAHEIAHQWWFGLVGNDQALEPWLDEALAVYSERIFYQYNYPNYGDWWWKFRVNYFSPQGYVDSNIYSFGTFRSYVSAVYLNGANFLEDLRTRIGDQAFFAFLKDYASRFAHGHATGSDFFAVLRQHTKNDFSDIMHTYFQQRY